MAAYSINLLVEKNTDFSTTITITDEDNGLPLNLTGFTAEAKIKRSFASVVSQSFVVEFIDRVDGVIGLSLTNTQTALLTARRYVYDLVVTSPAGIKTRMVEGIIEVSPGAT
jgi:hypothetical protein